MANKTLYDRRAQARQDAKKQAVGHIYRQLFSTLSLVVRAMQRWVSRGVTAIVARLKQLALPEGPHTAATMLAKAVSKLPVVAEQPTYAYSSVQKMRRLS